MNEKTTRDVALDEVKSILETLFHQKVITEAVYQGLITRLKSLNPNPYELLYELRGKEFEISDSYGNRQILQVTAKPITQKPA